MAVLLRTDTTAQDNGLSDPDTDYPNLTSLEVFSYSDTAGCPNPGLAQQIAYIAAEFSQVLFPENDRYVVGDSTQPSDVDEYVNGPLCYGATYTFFLRAYVGEPGSRKRQTGRDYTVFSSSDFTPTVSTRMSQTYWTPFLKSLNYITVRHRSMHVMSVKLYWFADNNHRQCSCWLYGNILYTPVFDKAAL